MLLQSIKNFNVNLNASNGRGTFSSGDVVSGHISFDLSKQTKISAVTVTLAGCARVHWRTGGKKNRRTHSARVDYFKVKSVVLGENCAIGGPSTLPPGTHVYPIACQIPQGDFPSSFIGFNGRVMYTLTVAISRPWHLTKDFVTELNFTNRINPNQPVLQAPLSGTNDMTVCCLCCASGHITMTASVEKKAFVPGESVNVICKFSNSSSRTATPKVILQQKQVAYTANRIYSRMGIKKMASVTGQRIDAHTYNLRTEITLPIPSSASLTISNCSILDVEYLITVTLSVSGSTELQVLIPIILCDTPVHAQPPPYL